MDVSAAKYNQPQMIVDTKISVNASSDTGVRESVNVASINDLALVT